MKNKSFDCVDMKHRAAANIYRELAGKSETAQMAYWKKQFGKMKKEARSMAKA